MPPTPGMPPPPGGAGVGPATAPGPMAGSAAHGMTGVKIGLEALQKALPSIPMGSELHNDLMKAISSISKHMADQGSGQGSNQIQQLMELIRAAKTGGAQPNMAAMMPGAGGAGSPAPMSPPGAPAPPPPGPM